MTDLQGIGTLLGTISVIVGGMVAAIFRVAFRIQKSTKIVAAEMTPNGGSSIKDQVADLHSSQIKLRLQGRLTTERAREAVQLVAQVSDAVQRLETTVNKFRQDNAMHLVQQDQAIERTRIEVVNRANEAVRVAKDMETGIQHWMLHAARGTLESSEVLKKARELVMETVNKKINVGLEKINDQEESPKQSEV